MSAVALDEIFGPAGELDRQLKRYEFRPSQLKMARAVELAIEQRHHLCVEAGTGTGKTLAYLVPALMSGRRALVSTATRNLQDQLLQKDLPLLLENLFPHASIAVMKGRQNYLCLHRLEQSKVRQSLFPEPGDFVELVGAWAEHTETGDRTELEWLADDDSRWNELDARSEHCIGQKCPWFEPCFVTLMRQRAYRSDLVIVNHALLFASLSVESDEIGRVLPDFSVCVLDEAHEVEDIAANHFGIRLSNYQFEELLRDVARSFPLTPDLQKAMVALERDSGRLFGALPEVEGRHSLTFFQDQLGEPVDLRDRMAEAADDVGLSLIRFRTILDAANPAPAELETLSKRAAILGSLLDQIFAEDDPNSVRWFERRARGVFLNVSPINVSQVLRDRLFDKADSVILTSATLTVQAGSFEYFKTRVGVAGAEELRVDGEFDYASQAVLYIPGGLPRPNSPGYFESALREIRQLLEISEGHAFLLFTSFQNLRRVHQELDGSLRFPLLVQGEMPKNRLIEVFKVTPHAVLLGTASFWQGVDVQGPALSAVVIDKLPFRVPSEPLVAARLHHLEVNGENSFYEYSVPDAIITLKQGLGRLIRSKNDRGVLAVLDSRIRTQRYGRLFLDSLPNCPVTDNIHELRNFFRISGSRPKEGNEYD